MLRAFRDAVLALALATAAFAAGCTSPPPAASADAPLRLGVAAFGDVDPLQLAAPIAAMGFDYLEPALAKAVAMPAAEREAAQARLRSLGIAVETMNWFLPPELKVTGPDVDPARVQAYLEQALAVAESFGAKVIVFGSPRSRSHPDGFPRERALQQLQEFLRACGETIERRGFGMVIGIEALRRPETNLVNSVAEALQLARAVDHAKVRIIVDFYHLAFEHEDPAVVLQGKDWIVHVQLAAPATRGYPRDAAGEARYAQFFANLRQIGYRGRISVEGTPGDFAADAPPCLAFLRTLLACRSTPTAPPEPWCELRDGLANSAATFAATGRGRVAFLGGSITHNPGWREQVCEWLQRRWPHVTFDFVAAGIPSMGSLPGAFRCERDVFARGKVDLLFEEAAVNDSTNGHSDREQLRAMEGIVRHARANNPAIDVVLMHFADPDKLASYGRGATPQVIANHERVAAHYRLPSLDLAREVHDRIARGEFTWADDFRDLHPSPFGQRLYAASITRLLDAAWPAAAAPSPHPAPLPPPLDPWCYDQGLLLPPGAIVHSDGFALDARWQNRVGGGTREGFVDVPMLVGERPGAQFTMSVRGRAIGLFVAAGPDAGTLEYRVDGMAWRTVDLFTPWSAHLHLPWLVMLADELDAAREHRLEVRIAEQHHRDSRGHACRIAHFAYNGN